MEWIDVTKQMPKHCQVVFFAYANDFDCCSLGYFDAEECKWFYDATDTPIEQNVRYWMPVTQLPNGKEITM